MNEYKIITDGSWDMGAERAALMDVEVIPYMISMDGLEYKREINELPVREFYQMMVDNKGVFPKTSLPALTDIEEAFEKYASAGVDVICFTLTSNFSGAHNAMVNIAAEVCENHPGVRITVVDTRMATLMIGLLLKEMVKYKRSGASYDELLAKFEEIKESAYIYFTVENMDYLIHGGRVGKWAGMSANALNLRPIVIMSDGELKNGGLARGRKKSREKAVSLCFHHVKENGGDPDEFSWMVGYGYDEEEGREFREYLIKRLKEEWPDSEPEVDIGQIGATIGVHTGPYPLGLGIIRKV